MKKIKRLAFAVIALVMSAFVFTGCEKTSSQIETEAVAAIREANIESVRQFTEANFAALLVQAKYEDFATFKQMNQVLISFTFDNDFGARWKYFTERHGACVNAVVDETMRKGYEYTSRIIMTGEDNRQMALTISYDQGGQPYKTTIAEYEDDSQQTFGQKMAAAGGNTIIGILVVFSVLILLSLIIYCFKFVNQASLPPSKKTKEAPAPVKAAPAPAPVKAETADEAAAEDDPALIAVIAAAIAAAEDRPAEGFVVRSVRRLKTNKWR
ncbi:MAG: OadG family protein [Lachnospiraceae bacterium]|nr:OadG family protein [Lachnospiraceae bacterium]